MNHDQARTALEKQITTLVAARDEGSDAQERAGLSQSIELLEDEVDNLDVVTANELDSKMDDIIGKLDKILNEKGLDAASALGRAIDRLQQFLNDPTAVKAS